MDQWKAVFDWCTSHWAFCVFIIGMIFEIPSFKLKPFSRLLGAIGRRLNIDESKRIDNLDKEIKGIKTELDLVKTANEKQMELIDKNDANFIRTTILEFANSLLQGMNHTQEEYDHIIDVRSPEEFAEGHPEGAVNVPLAEYVEDPVAFVTGRDAKILFICQKGIKSRIAADAAIRAGFRNVESTALKM